MERNMKAATVAVTAEEVRAALPRTRSLTSEEEKALRMRYGAAERDRAPLPRAAGDNEELADELLLIEMQLMRAWRARLQPNATRAQLAPEAAKRKDKIVRALRKKRS
jgi:hypothetical protein